MIVVEICRAWASGSGPSDTIQAAKAPEKDKIAIAAAAANRMARRLLTSSWPGLSRPPTSSLFAATKVVDARVICAKTRFALLPGHDEEEACEPGALISPDAPRRRRCRCGHSARDCTCPRHRPAAARIC